jgi:hypothetical protein
MIQRPLLILVTFLAFGFGAARAQSQNAAVFTVPEVPVYAEADTAAAAQRLAQEQGRRRAMDLLLRRLTAEEDWVYLPTLAADRPAEAASAVPDMAEEAYVPEMAEGSYGITAKRAVQVQAEDLTAIEEGFAIFDEKTSRTTYRARITYRFKPSAVRSLLETANLPYSEAQARRALILPVLQTENGVYLWEAKNAWARAWLARPLNNELTPLILPNGDSRDIQMAPIEEVRALSPEVLAELAERYNTQQIILALGKLEEGEGEYRLYVQLLDAYLDGRTSARQRLDASRSAELYDDTEGYGSDGVVTPDAAALTAAQRGGVLVDAYFRGPTGDFPALAQRAVESTVAKYAKGWKAQTLVDHSAVRSLTLTAWFGTLDEWADIRLALEGTPLVREMKVGAFNNENAVIDLSVIGDQDQFLLAMRQENLTVWQGPRGDWNIASFDLAQQLQSRLDPVAEIRDAVANGDGPAVNREDRRRFGLPLGRAGDEGSATPDRGPELPAGFGEDDPALNEAGPTQLDTQGQQPVTLETAPSETPGDDPDVDGLY